jgi:hypothetical protein
VRIVQDESREYELVVWYNADTGYVRIGGGKNGKIYHSNRVSSSARCDR